MSVTILLAPSKTMDFTSNIPVSVAVEQPVFLSEAQLLASGLAKKSQAQIMKLMGVSKPIAESVCSMYAAWNEQATGRPALWTYKGDVYKGLKAIEFDTASANWAQQHLLIASGLYGLVRPYDGIQSYRLEMKTQLKIAGANNLYDFWGTKLSTYITATNCDWICNLCSNEYAKPVLKHLPKSTVVITPVFFDSKPNGTVGTVPIYSKMMRGVFTRWMIDNRIKSPEQLESFTGHGYAYDASRSRPGFPAFYRAVMKPLVFD